MARTHILTDPTINPDALADLVSKSLAGADIKYGTDERGTYVEYDAVVFEHPTFTADGCVKFMYRGVAVYETAISNTCPNSIIYGMKGKLYTVLK